MAVLLFTGLNCLGVVFLVYVLVQFWKERHLPKNPAPRDKAMELSLQCKPTVTVVTHPISHSAHAELSVVSRQARTGGQQDRQHHRESADGAADGSLKRFSTR